MSAVPIPGTLKVQCKCGWHGTTEDLRDKTCPICGEAFEAYPTSGVALGLIYGHERFVVTNEHNWKFDPITLKWFERPPDKDLV